MVTVSKLYVSKNADSEQQGLGGGVAWEESPGSSVLTPQDRWSPGAVTASAHSRRNNSVVPVPAIPVPRLARPSLVITGGPSS